MRNLVLRYPQIQETFGDIKKLLLFSVIVSVD